MQDRLNTLAVAFSRIARLSLYASGICLVAMTTIVGAQVFFRYVLGSSIIWSEPIAIQLMGWFIFLGAAVGTREGYHLSFDVLLMFLPDPIVKVLYSISDISVGAFGFGMIWFGYQLTFKTWGSMMPTLGIPDGVNFIPIILGGVLVLIFSIERLLRRAAGMPTARFGEDAVED